MHVSIRLSCCANRTKIHCTTWYVVKSSRRRCYFVLQCTCTAKLCIMPAKPTCNADYIIKCWFCVEHIFELTGLQDVGYDSALSLIIDIRTVIPGSGTTAPVGWAALPLFQNGPGRYMASGYYQLPIFKASPYYSCMQLYTNSSIMCVGCAHTPGAIKHIVASEANNKYFSGKTKIDMLCSGRPEPILAWSF